ncbi:MAG: hypothetical protein KGH55_00005, partial [Nanoarchaeota archaeon]|nr:hypothetical protein [Nanoarchaeota archaeon]
STTKTDPYQIQDYLKQHLSGMNYLTIMAASSMVPIRSGSSPEPPLDNTFTSQLLYALSSELDFTPSLDPSVYADVNGDHKPDVAVGRIAGLGTADVSGYIARDLFYNQISTNSKNKVLLMGSSFYGTLANLVMNIGTYFKDAGYQNTTLASSESEYSFDSSNLIGQGLIFYADHGDSFIIGGIHSEEIPLLDNSLFDVAACDTVSSQTANSFWSWAIRKGSVGYLGAVSTTFLDTDSIDFLNGVYYDNSSLGVAFKNSYKFDWFNEMTTLIGDPTFNIQPPHKLNQKIQVTLASIFSVICTPQGNFCGFGQVLWHCCPGNTCQWFTCQSCLPSGTTVNLLTQGNCCGSWTWATRQDANFCCYNKPTYASQDANFCGWCANGASSCWPWDWRAGWDAAHCGTHSTQHYDWGCWWNANYCGTSAVNDHKVCT